MKNFLRIVFGSLCVIVAGCSTYEKRFAAASHTPAKAGNFAGAYSGKWVSSSHPGGGGNLHCILSQTSASGYLAEFRAAWHGFHSEHSVVLHTKKKETGFPDRVLDENMRDFEGTSKLRTIIGAGTYTCKGWLNTASMAASYDATYDKGTFTLGRVGPGR